MIRNIQIGNDLEYRQKMEVEKIRKFSGKFNWKPINTAELHRPLYMWTFSQ